MSAPTLPPLYAAWTRELLGGPLPSEPRSTCSACAMVATGGPAEDPGPRFLPNIKCCMFLPKLPNFLVGRALLDEPGPGPRSVLHRLSNPSNRSPLGLLTPPDFAEHYEEVKKSGQFGREIGLRCPHYLEAEGGICGIWAHRESVCTTWFCRHERGAVSRHFWSSLQQLLAVVEDVLSRTIARDLGAAPHDWGPWQGREVAYYEAAATRVEQMTWRDVTRIGAFEVRFRARLVKEAYGALSETGVPPVLVPGRIRVVPLPDGRRRVFGYSAYDPADLAVEVVDLLGRFTGRTVAEVLQTSSPGDGASAPAGLILDEPMLQRLFDLRVLDLPPEA